MRGLDLGTTCFYVEAAAPRVSCRQHGVVVARVPWARHGSRFLCAFEDQVAWLATQCSQKACSQLMRLDWQTVGRIITRVVAEVSRSHDRLDRLHRIGIETFGTPCGRGGGRACRATRKTVYTRTRA